MTPIPQQVAHCPSSPPSTRGQEGSVPLQPRTARALPRRLRCSPCGRPRSLTRTAAGLRAFAQSVRAPLSASLPRLQLRSVLKGACAPPFSHTPKPSRTLSLSCRALAMLCHVTSFGDCLSKCPLSPLLKASRSARYGTCNVAPSTVMYNVHD